MTLGSVAPTIHRVVSRVSGQVVLGVNILQNAWIVDLQELWRILLKNWKCAAITRELCERGKVPRAEHDRMASALPKCGRYDRQRVLSQAGDQCLNRLGFDMGHVGKRQYDWSHAVFLKNSRGAYSNRMAHSKAGGLGNERLAARLLKQAQQLRLAGRQHRDAIRAHPCQCLGRAKAHGLTLHARQQFVEMTAGIEATSSTAGEQ